jgi:hypothetical protein
MEGSTMTNTVKPGKTVLSADESRLLVLGLEAGAREALANAATARRLGYTPQAAGFEREARAFASLAGTAKSVRIEKITVRHS